MASPAFGSIGTQLQTSTSTPSVDVPDSVASGDIIVVTAFIDGALPTITLATGFAHAGNSPTEVIPVGGGRHSIMVAWKRATGSEDTAGTYDFTLSGSTYVNAAAARYTGAVGSGDPWDVTNSAVGDVNGTAWPTVSVTTTVVDTLLVGAATNWSGGAWTPPTGFTERRDSGDAVCTVVDLAQAAIGSSGSVSGSCAGSDRRTAWLGALKSTSGGASAPPSRRDHIGALLQV